MENLIWLHTGFLGDLILATGGMALARKKWPNSRQVLITTPIGKAALDGAIDLDEIVVYDKRQNPYRGFLDVKQQLRNAGLNFGSRDQEHTIVLQAHLSFRSSMLSLFLGFPTIKYRQAALSMLAFRQVDRVPVRHEYQRIVDLLQPLGVKREEAQSSPPRLARQENPSLEVAKALVQSLEADLIGIAPGSVWGTKRWPTPFYSQLVGRLLDLKGANIVLLGSREEKAAADFIEKKNSACSARIVNLAGKTTLADLRYVVPRLKMLVCNDSSLVHYGSAFNIPTVAIFGATIPALGFAPLAANSVIMGVELNCRPCSLHGPQQCPLGHFDCMKRVQVDMVFAKCRKILMADSE